MASPTDVHASPNPSIPPGLITQPHGQIFLSYRNGCRTDDCSEFFNKQLGMNGVILDGLHCRMMCSHHCLHLLRFLLHPVVTDGCRDPCVTISANKEISLGK